MSGEWNPQQGGTRKELEKSVAELREKVKREAEIWSGANQRHPDGIVWMMAVVWAIVVYLVFNP